MGLFNTQQRNTTLTSCLEGRHNMPPPPASWPLTRLLTLKVVSESRVTWATSVPILVFLGLSVLDLSPMYATDRRRRQTSDGHHRLMHPPYWSGGIITNPMLSRTMPVVRLHKILTSLLKLDVNRLGVPKSETTKSTNLHNVRQIQRPFCYKYSDLF